METLVYPDGLRGLYSLLDGFEVNGHQVRPQFIVPANYADYDLPTVVHLQRINATQGHEDRVEEVRLTVYAFNPLHSQDIAEAILSYICGDGISTPAVDESIPGASDGAAAFYFDEIRQRVGPSSMDWPTDQVFPVSMSVDLRARPMTV